MRLLFIMLAIAALIFMFYVPALKYPLGDFPMGETLIEVDDVDGALGG